MQRTLLASLALLTLFCGSLAAQVDPGKCDSCYKNYVDDRSLVIGGHQIDYAELAVSLYPMSLHSFYAQNADSLGANLRDSTDIVWVVEATHPWGGYWAPQANGVIDSSARFGTRVADVQRALKGRSLRTHIENGIKVAVNPAQINLIYDDSEVRENYYVLPPGFQNYVLNDSAFGDAGHGTASLGSWRRATYELLTGQFYRTKEAPGGSDTIKLGGEPNFISSGFKDGGEDRYLDLGLTNHKRFMSLGFALRTDLPNLQEDSIGSSTVIAYAPLFVRNEVAQDTCRCWFMEPWDTIEITKGWFLERVGAGQVHTAFDAKTAGVFYDIDTLLNFNDTLHGETLYKKAGEFFGKKTKLVTWTFRDTMVDGTDSTFTSTDSIYVTDDWCNAEFARRQALSSSHVEYLPPSAYQSGEVDDGDFYFEILSTGVVPLSLLRSRLATPHYINLREGEYDSIVAQDIADIYADSLVDSLVGRIGPGDEPINPRFRAYGMLVSKIQEAMDEHPIAKDRPKKIWGNPKQDYDAWRILTGDYDSIRFKQIQVSARQIYRINGGDKLPITYANPSLLGEEAWYDFFRAGSENPIVAINDSSEYEAYNAFVQDDFFGEYIDDDDATPPTVTGTVRLVDIMQFKYNERFPNIPASPVWNVVQTHGFMGNVAGSLGNSAASFSTFGATRTPTPEEIAAQAWLSMASGASGVIFGDLPMTGLASGPQTIHIYPSTLYPDYEYGTFRSINQSKHPDSIDAWRVDNTWLGLHSRNVAMSDVINDLLRIDTVIGWHNLRYNREQMTVHDTRQSFDEIPMVTSLRMEKADRYDHTYDDSTQTGTFNGTGTFDSREKTYAELTHFRIADDPGARAILIVNRRCWPIDMNEYDSLAEARMHELDTNDAFSLTGFGAIDVRRPVLVLENNTSIFGDSAIVEKVTRFGSWIDTVAFGDTIELDWLRPARGALYVVRPYSGGISEHATAYNNAVHSENPSDDDTDRDRLVVYERDSVVYLRSVDPSGVWSNELMISDPDDTVLVSGNRTASNFFPAIAILRDSSTMPRVVWERDSLGYHSVVTATFGNESGVTRATIDSLRDGEYDVVRHRLSTADSLVGPPALTPSIVAVNRHDSLTGYVISWADHEEGVNALALRPVCPEDTLRTIDSAGIYQIIQPGDPAELIGQYPTLATVDIERLMILSYGTVSGSTPESDTMMIGFPNPTPVIFSWLPSTHLAWQQGDGVDGFGEQIFYTKLGTDFETPTAQPTIFADSGVENVTRSIIACSFEHPSIAADSVKTGVAFEIIGGGHASSHVVGTRFRDTMGVNPFNGFPTRSWQTYVYAWSRNNLVDSLGRDTTRNVRPSLTHFPSLEAGGLVTQPEGGLTWFWQNNAEGRGHPQFLYRYGWFEPREIGDGAHPSLTLVPLRSDDPFAATSILHRGDSAARVTGENDEGEDVWYYSGHLINTPGNPMPALFASGSGEGGIQTKIRVSITPWTGPFCMQISPPIYDYGLLIGHSSIEHPDDDRHTPGDPSVTTSTPGLPPTFFEAPEESRTLLYELEGSERVTRTSLFIAGEQPVTIHRQAAATDSISQHLDAFPYDTERSTYADIWSVVELVKASDSTVLWRGDTISARHLDTTDTSPVSGPLAVPVDLWADSGEVVFIQIRAFATSGVPIDIHGGFSFLGEIGGGGSGAKRVIREESEETRTDASLSLQVVPNPVDQGRATLHVTSRLTGRIEVSVWDTRGQRVGTLPSVEADRAGTYSVELDLGGIVPGSYLVRAVSGDVVVSERVTVVR